MRISGVIVVSASVMLPPQPYRNRLVSSFSSLGNSVTRGIAFTRTFTFSCAHMLASAMQISSSFT